LTVLFSDLVGSAELSARFDPEEMSTIVRGYQNAVAHEDDAERAVRAGLGLADAVSKVAIPGGEALFARVGIATGAVVVGDLIGGVHR